MIMDCFEISKVTCCWKKALIKIEVDKWEKIKSHAICSWYWSLYKYSTTQYIEGESVLFFSEFDKFFPPIESKFNWNNINIIKIVENIRLNVILNVLHFMFLEKRDEKKLHWIYTHKKWRRKRKWKHIFFYLFQSLIVI